MGILYLAPSLLLAVAVAVLMDPELMGGLEAEPQERQQCSLEA